MKLYSITQEGRDHLEKIERGEASSNRRARKPVCANRRGPESCAEFDVNRFGDEVLCLLGFLVLLERAMVCATWTRVADASDLPHKHEFCRRWFGLRGDSPEER